MRSRLSQLGKEEYPDLSCWLRSLARLSVACAASAGRPLCQGTSLTPVCDGCHLFPSPTSLPTCPSPGGQLPAALAAGSQVSLPLATRRKLFELARAFSEKTKMRKSKRKHLLKHQSYPFQPGTGWQWWMRRVLKTLGWTP